MKRLILLALAILSISALHSQLVITEIMYNPPEGGEDTTEYIEIMNVGTEDLSLLNYSISEGIEMTFGDISLESGRFLVITKNNEAFQDYYGFSAIQWDSGSLSNSGEDIIILNADGDEVDVVDFDDGGDWPTEPDGNGYSLELCDPFKDNNDGINWKPSITQVGKTIDGKELFASPGEQNEIICAETIDYTVEVLSLQFSPKHLTIEVGQTVQWINNSGGNHNVNGTLGEYPDNPESFYSGTPSNDNWVFIHTFTIPGIYSYKCDLHYTFGMTGSIEVLPSEASKLLISEIMYNDPGLQDSLDYVEILNLGPESINLLDFQFMSDEILFTFPAFTLNNGDYLILSKYPEKIQQYFSKEALAWGDGSLKNNGDMLTLKNPGGNTVDVVNYDDVIPWPPLGDGYGHSINLCMPDTDNALPENWLESPGSAGFEINDIEIFANPGEASYCAYDIGTISQIKEDGSLLFDDLGVEIRGTVHGVNLRPGALQFTIIDDNNDGIALYNDNLNFGYEVHEGDKLLAIGKTGQYNGLAQVYLDTILFFGHQQALSEAVVVNELNEDTESQLVTIENVSLLNPSEWGGGSSGFSVMVSDGTNEFSIRIDNDVDLYAENYPIGTFNITGLGGQYDNSAPFTDGYQLFPRYLADIDPFVPNTYPIYSIGQVNTVDEEGVGDSLDVKCQLEGIVYGINFNPFGLGFTLIDENGDGINIYSGDDNKGYEVKEGDKIRVFGSIDQYNGLLQMLPSEVILVSADNDLLNAKDILELNEDAESQLVKIAFLTLVDPSQWKGDGNSFNVTVTNGANEFAIRVDGDCELSSIEAPDAPFHMTGIGGQYDSSSPYSDGYQLFPRYLDDLDYVNGAEDLVNNNKLYLSPNPAIDYFSYNAPFSVDKIVIYDINGRKIGKINCFGETSKVDITSLKNGIYHLEFLGNGLRVIQKLEIIR